MFVYSRVAGYIRLDSSDDAGDGTAVSIKSDIHYVCWWTDYSISACDVGNTQNLYSSRWLIPSSQWKWSMTWSLWIVLSTNVLPLLEAMFTSMTLQEYNTGYAAASAVILHDPAMRSKLDIYYFQPKRYAGYYLWDMGAQRRCRWATRDVQMTTNKAATSDNIAVGMMQCQHILEQTDM